MCKFTSVCLYQVCSLLELMEMNRRSKQTSCSSRIEPRLLHSTRSVSQQEILQTPHCWASDRSFSIRDLQEPWPLNWRVAWPQWTGSPSSAWGQPFKRRMRATTTATTMDTTFTATTMGMGQARKLPIWTLELPWTRRKLHSTGMVNHPTAMPASSPSQSMARHANGWPSVRSTSGSVTISPTTERQAAAGR